MSAGGNWQGPWEKPATENLTTNPSPVPALDLDALDELERQASKGPWWTESGTLHAPIPGRTDGAARHPIAFSNADDPDAEAEFIAALRNAAPSLIAAARERDEWELALHAIADEGFYNDEGGPVVIAKRLLGEEVDDDD